MNITLISVGRLKQSHERTWFEEYEQRIKRYCRFEEVELKQQVTEAQMVASLAKVTGPRSILVLLDAMGKSMSSVRFAEFVGSHMNQAEKLVFVVGGAYGFPQQVLNLPHQKISLSAMTFPHRLAKLLVAEQLYRAFCILRNEPYAHES